MKTIHRIMHDALTPEEYKNWCKYITKERICIMTEEIKLGLRSTLPSSLLASSFYWHMCLPSHNKQYWVTIINRLYDLERKL